MLGNDDQDERPALAEPSTRHERPILGSTRTRIRFAWFPTFTDDVESTYALAWLCHVEVTETFGGPAGETMFSPEPRWRTMYVTRARAGRDASGRAGLVEREGLAAAGD